MKIPLIFAAVAASLWAFDVSAAPSIGSPLVKQGDTAYAADGVTSIGDFLAVSKACINRNGDITFAGTMTSGTVGVSNDEGLWVIKSGSANTLLAREGDQAPGCPAGVKYSHFLSAVPINDAGVATFRASLSGTAVTVGDNLAIFKGSPGSVTLVARKGNFAPDESGTASGARFEKFDDPLLGNTAGNSVAFRGYLRVENDSDANLLNKMGIWTDADGSLKMAARTGAYVSGDADIPDAPGSDERKFSKINAPLLSGDDDLAFNAVLRPVPNIPATKSNKHGIWSGAATAPESLELDPQSLNEADGGGYFASFASTIGVNDLGEIAFNGTLKTGELFDDVTSAENTGVWLGAPGLISLVARRGDHAQGTGSSLAKFGVFFAPVLASNNDALGDGSACFVARLKAVDGLIYGYNNVGIWKGTASANLVARSNNSAPDENGADISTDDVVFYRLYPGATSINSEGNVAFRSMLRRVSSGLPGSSDDGIWTEQTDGTLVKVILDGDTLDGNTVQRHIFVAASGGSDGRPSAWTHNSSTSMGQLVFTAYLVPGSTYSVGIFLAQIP